MSKLSFKEVPYYEDNDIEDEVSSSENNDEYNKAILNNRSYTLYSIDDYSNIANDLIQSSDDTKSSSILNIIDNDIENCVAEDNNQDVKKKKRKKKKKSNNSLNLQESFGTNHSSIMKNENIYIKPYGHSSNTRSKFLSRFLNKKKEIFDIIVPEIQIANDLFLRQFNQEFINHNDNIVYTSDDESIDHKRCDVVNTNDDVDIHKDVLENDDFLDSDINNSFITNNNDIINQTNSKLQIFNLPYKITIEEIEDFAKRYDCNFINIKLGIDKKSKLPSGSATVDILYTNTNSENKDLSELIKTMQGENCYGRPIRIQRYISGNTSARNSLSKEHGRYFADDISCKCNLCGQVGHRQVDCVNDPIPTPCHLCAGQDHDAASCPNITCFRCGTFGHHSRDCRNAPMAKSVICTQCGSTTHDIRQCKELNDLEHLNHFNGQEGLYTSKVAGPLVRCMSCNHWGHVMCQALPLKNNTKNKPSDVYCPNCGESGHHIDYPGIAFCSSTNEKKRKKQSTSIKTSCTDPKFEAFLKYPQLLKDMDYYGDDKDSLYRDLLPRNPSRNELQMFPSLCSTNSNNGSNFNNIRNNNFESGRVVKTFYNKNTDFMFQSDSIHHNPNKTNRDSSQYDDDHRTKRKRSMLEEVTSNKNYISYSNGNSNNHNNRNNHHHNSDSDDNYKRHRGSYHSRPPLPHHPPPPSNKPPLPAGPPPSKYYNQNNYTSSNSTTWNEKVERRKKRFS